MNTNKLFRFGIIVGTLIVMNILSNWFIFNVIMSVYASIIGDGIPAYLLASVSTTVVVGICTILPLYWMIREDAEERRRFLTHFEEHEYNRENLRAYLKEGKLTKQDTIVFLLALLAVLIYRYALLIISSPTVIIDFVLEFVIIFGIYLLFNYFVRRALYDKWERERLHK